MGIDWLEDIKAINRMIEGIDVPEVQEVEGKKDER